MTTLSDLVQKTQRRVLSSMREETNTLAANMAAGDTSFGLTSGQNLGSIAQNSLVQIDYELLYVTNASSSSSINVIRGFYDSTATAHKAGALVTVNPRFPAVDIIAAINEDIADLSSPTNGLFQPREVTLSYNPVIVGYDLTDTLTGVSVNDADLIDLLEVRSHDYGPFQQWPVIEMSRVKLQRQADTAVFPSGLALEIYGSKNLFPGRPIRVQYAAPYTPPLVNASDDVQAVTGLQASAHDLPPLGATLRIMEFREIPRSFTEAQPQPRRAQEVPVGSSLTAMKGIMATRGDRIMGERARLRQMYQRNQWR